MKRYFLGMAAGYTRSECWAHTLTVGRKRDCRDLESFLKDKYQGEKVILTKNGRSALCLALKAYFKPGEAVIVNGFTCFAVYEAIKAAGLKPIWADISLEDLNFTPETLEKLFGQSGTKPRGIIVQNTLGNPVDMEGLGKFADKHDLIIIEDLAHSAGVRYRDGREAGTVGAAAAFSFGKDKSIDTVSGGAVVLRDPCKNEIEAPTRTPKLADHLRARFYPMLGAMCRGLTTVHLSGALMRTLVKIHWVEKSADNRLDLTRKISKFEARLALEQFRRLKKSGEPPLREFCLVRDRDEVLKELQKAGYYFGGFWYEKPVSPERYYKKTHFPEQECPMALRASREIINFPTYYSRQELAPARRIVEKYPVREEE